MSDVKFSANGVEYVMSDTVLQALAKERWFQIKKWGTHCKSPSSWILILQRLMGDALRAVIAGKNGDVMGEIRQIAATAIAAMEDCGTVERVMPSDVVPDAVKVPASEESKRQAAKVDASKFLRTIVGRNGCVSAVATVTKARDEGKLAELIESSGNVVTSYLYDAICKELADRQKLSELDKKESASLEAGLQTKTPADNDVDRFIRTVGFRNAEVASADYRDLEKMLTANGFDFIAPRYVRLEVERRRNLANQIKQILNDVYAGKAGREAVEAKLISASELSTIHHHHGKVKVSVSVEGDQEFIDSINDRVVSAVDRELALIRNLKSTGDGRKKTDNSGEQESYKPTYPFKDSIVKDSLDAMMATAMATGAYTRGAFPASILNVPANTPFKNDVVKDFIAEVEKITGSKCTVIKVDSITGAMDLQDLVKKAKEGAAIGELRKKCLAALDTSNRKSHADMDDDAKKQVNESSTNVAVAAGRRSGRTTRMINEAIRLITNGDRVVVIASNKKHAENLRREVLNIISGTLGQNEYGTIASRFNFETIEVAVNNGLSLRGGVFNGGVYNGKTPLIDHFAIEQYPVYMGMIKSINRFKSTYNLREIDGVFMSMRIAELYWMAKAVVESFIAGVSPTVVLCGTRGIIINAFERSIVGKYIEEHFNNYNVIDNKLVVSYKIVEEVDHGGSYFRDLTTGGISARTAERSTFISPSAIREYPLFKDLDILAHKYDNDKQIYLVEESKEKAK